MENNNYVIELLKGFVGQYHDPCAFVFHDKDGHEVITVMSDNKKLDKLSDGSIKTAFCAGDEKNPCKTTILPRTDVLDLPTIIKSLGNYNCAFHVGGQNGSAIFITTNKTDLQRLEYPVIDNYCNSKLNTTEDGISLDMSMDILTVVDGNPDTEPTTVIQKNVALDNIKNIKDATRRTMSPLITRTIYSAMNNTPEYNEWRKERENLTIE